ncbi:MAG: sugar phosphate isomerase/epimerase [Tannerellaceae bacterium]|nr:sugar phosphate isomerase/epimerase [Tannerellaceae bacterium]
MKPITYLFVWSFALLTACGGSNTQKPVAAEVAEKETRSIRFGLIPNTGADWYNTDPKACLAFVAETGYSYLESVGALPGYELEESREYVRSLGLKTVVMPTSVEAIVERGENLLNDIRTAKACEADYLVCYNWPLDRSMSTVEEWAVWADQMNQAGQVCKENGITLIYHNHDKEFIPVEDTLPFEVLMEVLDPDLVQIELDVYWTTKGGSDPVAIINKYPASMATFHLKDMHPETGDFEDVGHGTLDFPAILRACENNSVKYFIVEHDKPADPKRSIARFGTYLKNLAL